MGTRSKQPGGPNLSKWERLARNDKPKSPGFAAQVGRNYAAALGARRVVKAPAMAQTETVIPLPGYKPTLLSRARQFARRIFTLGKGAK